MSASYSQSTRAAALLELRRRQIERQKVRPSDRTAISGLPLIQFIQDGWHVLERRPFVSGFHIEAICEHLEAVTSGQIQFLIINMPPRHMKSLSVSVFWPAWSWTFKPWLRYLYASYAERLSVRDSRKCRNVILSPWYQKEFGEAFRFVGDQNAKTRFDNDQTGYRIATSVGGLGTGEGGDVVAVDDPHKAREPESKVKREAVLEWWDIEMSSRLDDPETGAFVIDMQRLHEKDLSGHALASADPSIVHLKLPAEYVPTTYVTAIGWKDPRTEAGELLWPERFNREQIDRLKKKLTQYGASGQLQQEPSPPEGGIIKAHWLNYWDKMERDYDSVIQVWDMTFKDTQSGSYIVGGVFGLRGADIHLLDLVRFRGEFTDAEDAVVALSAKWPQARPVYIEDKANGPAIISALKKKISQIIPINTEFFSWANQSKEARLSAASPVIKSGNYYLPGGNPPWLKEYIDELTVFPKSEHDDQVDVTSFGILILDEAASQLFIDDQQDPDIEGEFIID